MNKQYVLYNIKVGKETCVMYQYANKSAILKTDIASGHLNVAVSLASTVRIVRNAYHYQGVRMVFATIHLSVSVLKDGGVSFVMNVCI